MSASFPVPERLPKHREISEQLLFHIETGRWKPGDQLPSESELADAMQASLGTMQKALRTLSDQGVLVRRHGRGTFVIGARTLERNLRHYRFLDEDRATLLSVYMRVISIEFTSVNGPWSDFLQKEGNYVHLQRVMNINGEFDVFSEVFVSGSRFEALGRSKPEELDGTSIRDLLSERFNAPTLRVDQALRCIPLPPRVCQQIGVTRGTFGVEWEMRGRSYRDVPVTFQRAYLPPSDRPLQILDRT